MKETIKCAVMILSHDGGDERHRAFGTCIIGTMNAVYTILQNVQFEFHHFYETRTFEQLPDEHWHQLDNNMPLGDRHNRAMSVMMGYEWDYMMQLGSDDVVTRTGYNIAASWMRQGCPWGSFNKVGLVSPCRTKYKLITMLGNMGAGRFIRRDIVEKALKVAPIWLPEMVKGLDGNSEKRIMNACNVVVYPVVTYSPVVFDFKTNNNLHLYSKFTDKEREFNEELMI